MVRMILAQLRRRPSRAAALLVGVLLATTGFTVLTGSSQTSRLTVRGTVNEHARGAYDILVRPPGARTALEDERGLVRANFLSGQYGGITVAQWRHIQTLSGVDVAAPVAMLGYANALAWTEIDLTGLVDFSLETQLIRLRVNWRGDAGLTSRPLVMPWYYLTRRPLVQAAAPDGPAPPVVPCGGPLGSANPPLERQPDGSLQPVCGMASPTGEEGLGLVAYTITPRNTFLSGGTEVTKLTATVLVPISQLVAAIDPTAEAALSGLDEALTSGRFLAAGEDFVEPGSAAVLMASESYVEESVEVVPELVADPGLAGVTGSALRALTFDSAPDAVGAVRTENVADVYRSVFGKVPAPEGSAVHLEPLLMAGSATFTVGPDGTLRPREAPSAGETWRTSATHGQMPALADDTAARPTTLAPPNALGRIGHGMPVGVFDPTRLDLGDPLAAPLEIYTQPQAMGADARDRDLLRGGALLPTNNPGGYLATSPTVLVGLPTLLKVGISPDLISAIRVRVAGVTGFDDLSRERVRLVAEEIAETTGLDVEVTLGASGAPQAIALPAGKFGRPELRLAELWLQKGVAALIVRAIDRKSLILFGLILVVCVLFLANAAAAAVRERRRELAVLACLGWPRHRIAALFLGEVCLVGLVAGVAGMLLARPLGAAMGIAVTSAWLAVPVAVGLCLLAAAVPTLRASRAHPAAAVHRPVVAPGRWGGRARRRIAGLAVANLRRTPGRTLLGTVCLAVGIAGLTVVLAILWAFHGRVTGSLLGDTVSVRVRGVDLVAVVATVVLGVVAVADVLYLNIRDRAAELSALRAMGWSESALGRLVTYEGLGMALMGGGAGAGIGLWAATQFAGGTPRPVLYAALGCAAASLAVVSLAALVPVALQRRVPMSTLLAEE